MCSFFFFNDTATTEIYTLSLHDALPIWARLPEARVVGGDREVADEMEHVAAPDRVARHHRHDRLGQPPRSEEHTSELQSRQYLVCRLLLEKKKKYRTDIS